MVVKFTTVAGCDYQLQSNDCLGGGSWINSGSKISATGSTMETTVPAGGNAASRFYRIQLLD